MKRQYAGPPLPRSRKEWLMRYGPYVGAHWPAPSVRRIGSTWQWRRATSWAEEIGLVTYSKTPMSRVVRKVKP